MLEKLRKKIDELDCDLKNLLLKRLDLTIEIARYKAKNNLCVENIERENQVLFNLTQDVPVEYQNYIKAVYRSVFEQNKAIQANIISQNAIKASLVGKNVSLSPSKKIHQSLGTNYDLINVDEDGLEKFCTNSDNLYFNVTMPYKTKIIPYLDGLIGAAKECGVVNTVYTKNGKKWGYNTDIDGLRYLFTANNIDLSNKKVTILGAGATAKSAAYLAKSMNASSIDFVGRTARYNYDNYNLLVNTEILINTTPVGFNEYKSPIDLSCYKKLEFVADVVYSPLKTKLILEAEKRGIKCAGGFQMLVAQAVFAEQIWQQKDFSHKIGEIIAKSLFGLKNIVLIGMPGSGKTEIARTLAQLLDLKFCDTDEIISLNNNLPTHEIINSFGEDYFRQEEAKAVNSIALKQGLVIATGGGTVLSEQNLRLLKTNSFCVFIDRNLDRLELKNRPISLKTPIFELFNQRIYKYLTACDMVVKNDDSILKAAKRIIYGYKENIGY